MPSVRPGRAIAAWLVVAAIALGAAAAGAADDVPPGASTTTPVPPPADTPPPSAPPAGDAPVAPTTPTTPAAPAPTSTTTTTTTTSATSTDQATTTGVDEAVMTMAPAPQPGCFVVGAVGVVLPSQAARVVGPAAEAPPVQSLAQNAFAYPADGSVVSVQGVNLAASCGASHASSGRVAVRAVSLFEGWVTVASVSLGVQGASAEPTGSFSGLRVAGRALALQPGKRVKLGTWGYLSAADASASTRSTAAASPSQLELSALSIRLVEPRDGLPAGTVVLLPFAGVEPAPAPTTTTTTTAAASPKPGTTTTALATGKAATKPTTTAKTTTSAATPPVADHAAQAAEKKRERPAGARARAWEAPPPQPSPFHRPLTVTPPLVGGPYLFPVAGTVQFGDSYGGVRSDVASGWHHGDDIFAALGTPVVAVADGTLNRVGWERLGGWRLWVRDRAGDEFYYAHLSGYAPLALGDGTVHVRAGEVLGFVGNTGDAITTLPHLHFEVHPRQLLHLGYDGAVDPTSYLYRWSRPGRVEPPKPVLPSLPTDPSWRAEARMVFGELMRARGPFPVARPAVHPILTGHWPLKPEPFLPPSGPVAVAAAASRAPASSARSLTLVYAGVAAALACAAAAAFLGVRRRRGPGLPAPEPEPEPEG
jgi:murein DD-endopeptidase MepM/ murein hydrolase activator NlpD